MTFKIIIFLGNLQDNIIISLVPTDLATNSQTEDADPLLVVHPDYVYDV